MKAAERFMERIKKRHAQGLEALAVEFSEQLFQRLSETVNITGEEPSRPGDAPALFEGWFTENLSIFAREDEAGVGFTHDHAAQVYRLLVAGTDTVEPREGPEELYGQIREILQEAYREGFCRQEESSEVDEVPF